MRHVNMIKRSTGFWDAIVEKESTLLQLVTLKCPSLNWITDSRISRLLLSCSTGPIRYLNNTQNVSVNWTIWWLLYHHFDHSVFGTTVRLATFGEKISQFIVGFDTSLGRHSDLLKKNQRHLLSGLTKIFGEIWQLLIKFYLEALTNVRVRDSLKAPKITSKQTIRES